jgi:regulator of sirC expression with transglutaminase-like and TPR domain
MSSTTRQRLTRLVRRHDADLAEAALLCEAELPDGPDVDVALLRIDALADRLRSSGFRPSDPDHDAQQLAEHLAGTQGFTGDAATYHDPANGLLGAVLDRRRGLPITLSILYIAVARRLNVPAFPIALPGHVVTGIGGKDRAIVLDPFDGGRRLDEADMTRRVEETTGGRLAFRRSMLRPSPAPNVVRRLLNNLTRDFATAQRPGDALWTVELKLLLPNRLPDDHRVHAELLSQLGRFDEAASAYERYLEHADPDAPDLEEIRRAAIRSRARLN